MLKAPNATAVTPWVTTFVMVMLSWFVLSVPAALVAGRLLAQSAQAIEQGPPSR